jgi:hypothetical protein
MSGPWEDYKTDAAPWEDFQQPKAAQSSFDPKQYAITEAKRLGVPTDLALRMFGAESSWDKNAVSPKGNVGYGQLGEAAAKDMGVDRNDPKQNITGSLGYLKRQLDEFKTPELALAAYNAGPENVRKYGGIPPFKETQSYVKKILGQETQSDFLREELKKGSWGSRNLAGVGAAMVEGFEGLKGLVGMDDPATVEAARVTQQEAPVGGLVGNVAMMAPTMAIPGVNTVRGAAAVGGIYNALTTPGGVEDRRNAGVMGILGGGMGQSVSNALARGFKPPAEAQNFLASEGITLTPGQYAGGIWKNIEDKATSIPVLGEVINSARRRGIEDFNEAAIRRATLPGMEVSGIGNQAIQDIRLGLSDAYEKALGNASVPGLDPQFMQSMVSLGGMAQSLPPQEFKAFRDIISREVVERMAPNGKINADNIKGVMSGLENEAAAFSRSNDAYQRKLGEAIKQASLEFKDMVARNNPDLAGELQQIDKAYAHFKKLQAAAGGVGAEEGVFTPAQLHRAARAGDRTKDKRAFSEGTALYQDLTNAGKSVMPNKVPDSGTAGRMFSNLFSLKGLAGTVGGTAAAIPALGIYSKTGSKAANAAYNRLSNSGNSNALRLIMNPLLTQANE